MPAPHLAYIGLGSNLGQSLETLLQARTALHDLAADTPGCSRLYRSAPVGPVAQPDFSNAVVALPTRLGPFELLTQLQRIEHRFGRLREQHWGPRTLDLDIILWDRLDIQCRQLTLPHPECTRRAFVLRPLQDLAGADFQLAGHNLEHWLQRVDAQALQPLPWPHTES